DGTLAGPIAPWTPLGRPGAFPDAVTIAGAMAMDAHAVPETGRLGRFIVDVFLVVSDLVAWGKKLQLQTDSPATGLQHKDGSTAVAESGGEIRQNDRLLHVKLDAAAILVLVFHDQVLEPAVIGPNCRLQRGYVADSHLRRVGPCLANLLAQNRGF